MRRRMEVIRHRAPSPRLGVAALVLCAITLGVGTGGYLLGPDRPAWRTGSSEALPDRPAGPASSANPAPAASPGQRPPAIPRASGPPAPPNPTSTPTPTVTARTTTGTEAVALTFDDGPHGEWTPQFLDLLRVHGVRATFCLVGTQVRRNPALVARIVRDGHTLCNHTWHHDIDLGNRSVEEIRSDLQRTNDEIRRAVPGAQISYYRQPGGRWTPRVIDVATELGMTSIGWAVDPKDWAGGSASSITARVHEHTRAGSIVLMHDGGGDREQTLGALPAVLADLRSRFQLVALPVRPAP